MGAIFDRYSGLNGAERITPQTRFADDQRIHGKQRVQISLWNNIRLGSRPIFQPCLQDNHVGRASGNICSLNSGLQRKLMTQSFYISANAVIGYQGSSPFT